MASEYPTNEEIDAFIATRGWGNFRCEVCNFQSWSQVTADEWPMQALMAVNQALAIPGPFFPLRAVVCNHCANTKLIFLQTVQRWAQSEEGKVLLGRSAGNLFDNAEASGDVNG